MGQTQRFGFDYFGGTEPGSIEDNGGKFTDRDRRLLDRILAGLEIHDHASPASRLADPEQAPTLTLDTAGGELPSGETYYYRVSYVDDNGLETAAGDEVSIATPAVIAVPETPGLNAEEGGTLGQGLHQYAVSAISASNQETPLSAPALITLTDWRSVTIAFVAPEGATHVGIWRQGPLDGGYTKIGIALAGAGTFLDDGSVPSISDPCAPENLPPDDNLTNATNAITITLPAEAVGNDAISAWRIYRTTESGVYEPSSMVAEVVETTDELGGTLATTYVDTGDLPQPGQPLDVGQTLQGASQLILPSGAALPDPAGLPEGYPFIADGVLNAILGGAFEAIGGSSATPPNVRFEIGDVTLAGSTPETTEILQIGGPDPTRTVTLPPIVDAVHPVIIVSDGPAITLVSDSFWELESVPEWNIGFAWPAINGANKFWAVFTTTRPEHNHDAAYAPAAHAHSPGDVQTPTAAYTAVATDYLILADATAVTFAITLPAATDHEQLVVKKIDASANAVTIETPGAETIDGAANLTLPAQWDVARLYAHGGNWYLV